MVNDKPVIRYLRKAKDKKCFIISYIASGVRKYSCSLKKKKKIKINIEFHLTYYDLELLNNDSCDGFF
jgi:hypothetical protein